MTKLDILTRLFEGVLDRQTDISLISPDGEIIPKDGHEFELSLCTETLEVLEKIIKKEKEEQP